MGWNTYSFYEFESRFNLDFPNSSSSLNIYQNLPPFTIHRFYLPVIYGILFIMGILGNAWVLYVIACVRWMGGISNRHFQNTLPPTTSSTTSTHFTQPRSSTIRRYSSNYQICVPRLNPASTAVGRLSRTSRNVQVYIICLCCCDLIVLLFLLFLISDLIHGQWPFRFTFLCRAYLASESINKFCVPFLLVALSGYCYSTVAECDGGSSSTLNNSSNKRQSITTNGANHSHKPGYTVAYCNRFTFFKSPLTSAFLSVCVAFSLVIPVFVYGDLKYIVSYNDSTNEIRWIMRKCNFDPTDFLMTIFTLYSFLAGYIIPSILFTCFYSSVFCVVYRRAKRSAGDYGNRRAPRTYRLTSVAKTTLGLVVFYQLCWTPYWSHILYTYITRDEGYSIFRVQLGYFVHILPYVCCTGCPIVYTLMNKNIKEAYQRIREARRMIREERGRWNEWRRLWTRHTTRPHPVIQISCGISCNENVTSHETELETLNCQREG